MPKSSVWTNPKFWTVVIAVLINMATVMGSTYIKNPETLNILTQALIGADAIAAVFIGAYFGYEREQAITYRAELEANAQVQMDESFRATQIELAKLEK